MGRFHNAGWRPVVAAELEFSLVHYNRNAQPHVSPLPVGAGPLGGHMYGVDVLHNNAGLLEDIRRACEIQQLPFDGIVKETAPSQYEVNMEHVDNPVKAADQIILLKRLIKGVARKHGVMASFMAKPFAEEAGNGMHMHCSILDEHGENIFDDGSDRGTSLLLHAIAGCMKYMPQSMAIFAPNFNSYRRFQPGALAPTSAQWGYGNRTVSLRVPAGSNSARRLEHRVAGADCNPYLTFAVILSAVIEGIAQQLDPGTPIEGDAYSQSGQPLPQYLPEAVMRFQESDFVARNLGKEMQRIYTLSKWQENAEFRSRISEFEYQSYLEIL